MVHTILAADIRGHEMARAAVEMGVWALQAERDGRSLARILGGTREAVATGISIGIQLSEADLAERALAAVKLGYRRVKVKISPGHDSTFLAAAREAIGPATQLTADANSAYTLADVEVLRGLDRFDLAMLEQPLDRDDLLRHAELQGQLRTPICLDESISSRERAEDMIALGAGRVVNIKPGRVGGFAQSLAIHDLCADAGIGVWCGGMLESGLGRAYNVALASLSNFVLPGDLSPSSRYWEEDVVKPEWVMGSDGMVAVPLDTPGIGVTVDEARIDALTVRREVFRA
jgi:O-succinylbenzoate synthase